MTRKTTSRQINKRRKGTLAVIMPWLKRFGMICAMVIIGAWFISWIVLSGTASRIINWTENRSHMYLSEAGFTVENVLLEGRKYSDDALILSLLNTQKGDPLFAFDPSDAKKEIESLEWIKAAHIERRWPDTIYIHLTERQPLAFLQQGNALTLIDNDGLPIQTKGLKRFESLIVVSGENAGENAYELLQTIQKYPDVFQRLEEARWISERRWDIILTNSINVKLPETNIAEALETLKRVHGEERILDKNIAHIDLRDQARMIVRTKPGALQEYKASLKPDNAI